MAKARDLYDADFLGERARRSKARTRHERRMQRFEEAKGAIVPRAFEHRALEAQVALASPLLPTEDRAKVEAAFAALFPDAQFELPGAPAEVRARAHNLTKLAEVLRHSRIRDAARAVLTESVGADGVLRFRLNKHAACAARANFVEGRAVLGAIEVEARAQEPLWLVEELTWIEGESDERLFGTKLHTLPPRRWRAP